jgi:hypothetical protein
VSKVSMAEAAKLFDVSRPTLGKHLREGKISGEHVLVNGSKVWQLDMSELKRVYHRRGEGHADASTPLHADLTAPARDRTAELQAEIRGLQAQLDAEREARALVQKHLDDLRRMLPGQDQKPTRRGWWPFVRR